MKKGKKKQKSKEMTDSVNCYFCSNCVYIGNGGYMCSQNNNVVIEDWMPSDDFFSCNGRGFTQK